MNIRRGVRVMFILYFDEAYTSVLQRYVIDIG